MKSSRWLPWSLAVLALACVAGGFWLGLKMRAGTPDIQAAQRLLALTLPDPQGNAHKLSQWSGKILVVNFWATWCEPCREEMPAFSRLQSKYAANGVQFVGIAFDSHDAVKEFSEKISVRYPLLVAVGDTREIMKALGNAPGALPFTVLLDAQGRPVQSRLGRMDEAELDAGLQAILQR